MSVKLKKINEQVIVITGATSGIGLTTARMAAERGAKLVLAARADDALAHLAEELTTIGAEVVTVTADVGNIDDVARIGDAAIERFGRIDTWINNAGISIFGRMEDVAPEDHHRLFQTNFWGVVNGSMEAVKRMKLRGGGALINLGSELSDHAIPLQGMYAASKHAVKGFTDSLRIELDKEGAPMSVTLIKPTGIDTMFAVHAKNYMDKEPKLPAPVYAPEIVADAIVFVGGAAKMNSTGARLLPRVFDKFLQATMFVNQKLDVDTDPSRRDALHKPDYTRELRERQGSPHHVIEHSEYTAAALRSKYINAALLGSGALLAAYVLTRRKTR
jgi:short-subunit dehydrogenase